MLERILVLVAASGCIPERTADSVCTTTDDCAADRMCDRGSCVVRPDAPATQPDASALDAEPSPDAGLSADLAAQCATAGYILVSGAGYLRSVPTGRTWLDARADCLDDVAQATHLIVLTSQAEVAFMATQLGWIGLSDRASEGVFVTVTGETGDLRPFGAGQPDNGSGSEDCVQMRSGGQLDDDQCGNAHRYVCECDGRTSLP